MNFSFFGFFIFIFRLIKGIFLGVADWLRDQWTKRPFRNAFAKLPFQGVFSKTPFRRFLFFLIKSFVSICLSIVFWAFGGFGVGIAVWLIAAFLILPIYYGLTQPVYHYKMSLDELVNNALIFLTFWGALIFGFVGFLNKLSHFSQLERCPKCKSRNIKLWTSHRSYTSSKKVFSRDKTYFDSRDEEIFYSATESWVPTVKTEKIRAY